MKHELDSCWKGEPGECGASCVCGVTYDGFGSLAEAGAFIDRHIARANSGLSTQQLEILGLLDEGLTTTEIGEKLWIERNTVGTHTWRMRKRLGAKTNPQLVGMAYRLGLLGGER